MAKYEDQSHPTKWLCDDAKTWRAGDVKLSIYWTVDNEDQADAIVAMMQRFTASQCKAMFRM